MTIGDYSGRRALYSPGKLALIDTGKTPDLRLTYAELNERANRLANWLRHTAGIGFGDRVAILALDGVEHLDCFFACSKLGALHTALNWRLHRVELAAVLRHTTPRALLYSDEFRETVADLQAENILGPDLTIHLDGEGIPGSVPWTAILRDGDPADVHDPRIDENTTAALLLTGGTTGAPKAARITHGMIAWNTLNTVIHDLQHDDIYLNVFPLFHTGGLFVYTLPQFILGGTTVLMRRFDPDRTLELIERERVTVFAAVPTIYQALAACPGWPAADLSSLRFCTSGGAPLPVPLVHKYVNEKGIRFKQGFGMTEFGPGVFALAPEDAVRKAGSIGRPNFFVSARVVDDDNRPLGPGKIGELALKGPSRSAGYFNDPQATAEATDTEGWFHTGDLARVDEEGYFTIVDRKKDMFISGGENVYPAEVEAALYRHPAVHLCAVIGVPDARWGEVGLACVALRANAQAGPAELLAFLRDNLARYKVPRRVEILDALPLSSAGKVLKRELRERFSH